MSLKRKADSPLPKGKEGKKPRILQKPKKPAPTLPEEVICLLLAETVGELKYYDDDMNFPQYAELITLVGQLYGGEWKIKRQKMLALFKIHGLTQRGVTLPQIFENAIETDDLQIVELLYSLYGLTSLPQLNPFGPHRGNIIYHAAVSGNTNMLLLLHLLYGLTSKDLDPDAQNPVIGAAAQGHADVLRVLYDVYGFDTKDARSQDNSALRWAAQKNHVPVLLTLHELYKLTTGDARSHHNAAVRNALEEGHSDVLKILKSVYGLTMDDIRDVNGVELAVSKHPDLLAVLRKVYGLKPEEEERAKEEVRAIERFRRDLLDISSDEESV